MRTGLLQQAMEGVESTLQQVDVATIQFGALLGHRFEQRLDDMAQVADGGDAGHARTTLDGVQVALQADDRLAGGRIGAKLLQQAIDVVKQVDALFDEDVDEVAIEFVEIEHGTVGHDLLRGTGFRHRFAQCRQFDGCAVGRGQLRL